jgi:hypothetical protein
LIKRKSTAQRAEGQDGIKNPRNCSHRRQSALISQPQIAGFRDENFRSFRYVKSAPSWLIA